LPPTSARLILGSSSVYRGQLLEKLGLPFDQIAADIDESELPDELAPDLVLRLGRAKAEAIAERTEDAEALIIGSDQVACISNNSGFEILGKPHTTANAEAQLGKLSGHRVQFFTSLCLLRTSDGLVQTGLDETCVTFRDLSANEIRDYVAREQPLNCAGAFKSEALGIALFERLETQDPNALVGLPLILLCKFLRRADHSPLG
jgi:septum formation protein